MHKKQPPPPPLFRTLLNFGDVDVVLEQVDDVEETTLFHAAASGHASSCLILLERGADTEVVEPLRGYTPLLWAAEEGHEKVVEVLISFGANVGYKHPLTQQSALSLATQRG